MSPSPPVTVLGFDYGLGTIGVAVGNSLLGSAKPLPTLRARDGVPDWERVGALIREWSPALLLVGLPLNMDGTESEMSERARRFARRLHGRFGVAFEMVDERLSTRAARSEAAEADDRSTAIDSIAARLLIESWLAARG